MAPEAQNLRASDAERDAVAERIRAAAGEGRLTAEELDARLEQVYAATYQQELSTCTADLPVHRPDPGQATPQDRGLAYAEKDDRALRIHVVVVAAMAVFIVVRWIFSGSAFFWPVFPVMWLTLSVVIHALIRRGRGGRWPRWQPWGAPVSARGGR